MSKIPNSITTHWHDVKGNAKWDFIKWGAIAVIAILAAIIRFLQHAPLWQVFIAVIAICICVYFLVSAIQKFRNKKFLPDDRSRKNFTGMVDLIKSDKPSAGYFGQSLTEPIGALIKFSNEIRSENELEWFCDEFEKHNHGRPSDWIELNAGGFLKGQLLPVLKEARHIPREIKTDVQFLDFLAITWSGKDKWKEAQEKWMREVEVSRATNAKQIKAEKAVEKLTEYAEKYASRISFIKGVVDLMKYDPDRDDETHEIAHKAHAYFLMNLTPEAAQKFDTGITAVHGHMMPKAPMQGSTMYEERQWVMLEKLRLRIMNLKHIADNIDQYLK